MNVSLTKFNDFKNLNNYKFCYELNNGELIELIISQYNFPHIIGLQKLTDIGLITRFNNKNDLTVNAKTIIRFIKNGNIITESSIKQSIHYPLINDRYDNFNNIVFLYLLFKAKFYLFNSCIIPSSLNSKYLIVEKIRNKFFHIGLKKRFNW